MTQDIQSINELKSYTEYNVSTPTSVFTIGFPYEYDVDLVNVYVDGVEATAAGYTVQHDSHGTISLTPAVPTGVVRLQRETDIDTSAHTFSAGAKFTAGNMDENFQQIRHSQQEVRDGFSKLSTDTYEIIDTLQEVGEMAQDAADAAEQAAQTANDAAAQVNDKVSYQDLDNAIAATPHNNMLGRDTAGAHPVSAISYGSINQETHNNGVETIAELLAIQNPFDNMRVFVKSYRSAIGVGYMGEATPYKGGSWFVYKSSRAAENDGVFIFNGWQRLLESDTYTPYMGGCVCDGITDDTLNFDKLMYALEVNNMKGRVFVEDDMFFNNQCPLTGKLQYAMNFGDGLPVIRLVDNVDIEIKSTLKFGSFYNDKAIAVFNAKYNSDANDWLGNKRYNINIYGGGTLDFSQAGNMQTAYRNRICFSLANSTNSSVHNLTVRKGDFMNTIVTNYRGNGVDIHHMTFIDQMDDSSFSHDHSTMYLIAENCHVYANQFISSGVKSKLNACAVELHGNNQHMYGNKTILGYRNAVFVAAYKLGHEGVDDLYRGDISIKNNTADCLSFFKLWTDSVLPIGIIECENNIQKVPNFVTRQEVLDAGVDVSLWDNLPQIAHFFGTETDQSATHFPDSPNAYIKVHNNDYIGGVTGFDQDLFMYTPLIVRDGLDIRFNKVKARQLFTLVDYREYGQQMIMRRFVFKDNEINWATIYDRLAISTAPITFQNSEIDLNVDLTLATSLTSDNFFWIDVDAANTFNNKFSFKLDRTNQFNKSVGGSLTTQNSAFYSYNKLTYTARIDIQTYSEAGQKSVYLFSTDSRIVNGVSSVELKMLTASGAIPFIYPPSMSKDVRTGSLDRQVAALAYNTEGTPLPTGIYGYAVIST